MFGKRNISDVLSFESNFQIFLDCDQLPLFQLTFQSRVCFYVMQNLSDDVLTQKLGLVAISLNQHLPTGMNIIQNSDWRVAARKIMHCMPIRVAAIHICLPDSSLWARTLKALVLIAVGRQRRPRLRFHLGTISEAYRSLSEHGIPNDSLPLLNDNRHKLKTHYKWMATIQAKESIQSSGQPFEGIECPLASDVLFGKGQFIQSHPGNVGMRYLLELNYETYNACETRHEKSCIIHQIVHDIEAAGGRFLKEDPLGYWVLVSKREALTKVSMAFRDFRKRLSQGKSVLPPRADINMMNFVENMDTAETKEVKRASSKIPAPSKRFLAVVQQQVRPAAKRQRGIF